MISSTIEPSGRSPLAPTLPTGPDRRVRWSGLYGSSLGLAIGEAARRHHGPVMLVTADTPSAQRIEVELAFYHRGDVPTPLVHFPDWETLPYDVFSPHQDIVSERLATLARLPDLDRGVLIVPVTTLMVRVPPPEFIAANALLLSVGDRLDIDVLRQRLQRGGYRNVGQVLEHGEYAVRGSLLDIFPMGATAPLRVDLFDDEIEAIRSFDPETQRSADRVDRIRVLPARETPVTDEAVAGFRRRWRARFEGEPMRSPIYRDVSQGLLPAGIEYYLPLFFDQLATLVDYLPAETLVVLPEEVHAAAEHFTAEVAERYEQVRHDRERPLVEPDEMFLRVDELYRRLGDLPRVRVAREETGDERATEFATRPPPSLPVEARAQSPLAIVRRFVDGFDGRVLLVAETAGRRETLVETFGGHGLRLTRMESWSAFLDGDERLGVACAPLEDGALLEDPAIAVIAESQLFGERTLQRRRRARAVRDAESIVRDLTELAVGAPVVHEDHGVGRYLGLETLETGGLTGEYLCLQYAGGDKLYVPVASLHLVTRYTGAEPEVAPLHRLGSPQWQKAREKAARRARDVAAELLEVYARREARPGITFDVDTDQLRGFEDTFRFEETPDQQAAIEAVLADMASPRPMDRVVCGDVGFGKTEVAMRAAFVAVQGGRQVAILVPTTLLAQQHHQTFTDRFADWPVRIEQLSRFRSKKEKESVLAALAEGKVDIVIGTHQLIQPDIRFKRLGLVVIDEEHRFGVRQKERLKALRAECDVLTLTATPIPRTLNMALSGLRDLSLITTPPERRLSIKTFVRQWDNALVREAVMREIHRGGQVYFVHNKVENIERIAREVGELVPEASLRVAHGQMREQELERTMADFYHRRFNVLVCTTIIETGIDVPSANTILINRADHFGLAQLHQLRGRVGRSHHRAYAYLIVPDRRAMTADAVKRLEAIEALEDLGIGFTLATHDLEIRGAGELLGEDQSGQMQEVGYAMYSELLERAVRALKAGKQPELDRPLDHGAEIDVKVPALIPEDYLPDVHARLIMYKRIASAPTLDALEELQVEMIDRFGSLPDPARNLFKVTAIKLRAQPLGVRRIDFGDRGGRLLFDREPQIDPANVIRLIQSEPGKYRLDGPDRLRVSMPMPDADSRFAALEGLLDVLSTRAAA